MESASFVPFHIDLDLGNRFGVAFDYKELPPLLKRFLGRLVDANDARAIEEEWVHYLSADEKPIWLCMENGDLRQVVAHEKRFHDILRRHLPFGVLLPTPMMQDNSEQKLYLFMEFARKRNNTFPYWASYSCSFSLRDSNAKEIPVQKTHAMQFSEVLRDASFPDGTLLLADPGIIWRALANIAHNAKDAEVVERIAESIEEEAASCVGANFSVDTGLRLKADITDIHASKNDTIYLSFTKGGEPHFLFGRNRTGILCRKCLPPLEQFAVIDNKTLAALAAIADGEDWTFTKEDGTPAPLGRLRYYLEYTFEKIHLDHEAGLDGDHPEIVNVPNEAAEVFCTGLVHRDSGVYIYAYCSEPHLRTGVFQKVEWVFQSRQKNGGKFEYTPHPLLAPLNRTAEKRSGNAKNYGLPYPVNWVDDPDKLIVPYHLLTLKKLEFNYPHLFKNRVRFKAVLKDIGLRSEFNQEPPSQEDLTRLKDFVETAWERTRKLLQANYKVAVPVWYDKRISVLLPLFMDERNPNTPTIALVLTKHKDSTPENPKFFVPTCLTLEMARNNARVIARMDDTWLATASPEEMYRRTEEAICSENNKERKCLLHGVLDAVRAVMEFDARESQSALPTSEDTFASDDTWSLGTILSELNNLKS